MIDFLLGAMSLLLTRADRIVDQLESKKALPQSVLAHCVLVANKTRTAIDDIAKHLNTLRALKRMFDGGRITLLQAEPVLRGTFRAYRDSRRQLDAYEEFFVGHIDRFIPADVFLSGVAEKIWTEAGLPGMPPVAVTSTSGYFCTVAPLGIIFCPPSTEDQILILPDLYHESGHILPERVGKQLQGSRFDLALKDHAKSLRNQIRRISRPLDSKDISDIISRWQLRWAEEVACDSIATRLVGPAYAWCNLHLCLRTPNIYEIGAEHPSDAARTAHILRVLKRCGWHSEANEVEARWNQYVGSVRHKKARNHDDYHPTDLFVAIMEDSEEAVGNLQKFDSRPESLASLLNIAWHEFLADPLGYDGWQTKAMAELRSKLILDPTSES